MVFFPTPPGNSLTPTKYPTIQLSSDSVYLEKISDPLGPIRLLFTSDANHKTSILPVLLTCWVGVKFPLLPPWVQFAWTAYRTQKTCLITRLLFFTKDIKEQKSIPRWKYIQGEVPSKGFEVWVLAQQHVTLFWFYLQAFGILSFYIFMEAPLLKHDWLKWWWLHPNLLSSLPGGQE